ncbi:MAG TPA: ABC transporter substrate-binding protein [Candidatus Didemnitutus sp.]|nr:ABC transporter substrate-binding protein [Candidatus Didemnitutus sp.]
MKSIRLLLRLAAICAASAPAFAANGVSPKEIVVGQSAALSGPTQALGLGMRNGLEVAFKEINDAGGIHGRTVKLVSRDDGYEPKRAGENARALLSEDDAFLLIGCVGTPTAAEILPLASPQGAPFFAPFTGAGSLRTPYNPLIVNLRVSYAQEIERLVTLLVEGRGLKKIACFYQDDLYGQAGLKALQASLKKRNLEASALGLYLRNTRDVTSALASIVPAKPEAVILVGTYGASADFIKAARKAGLADTVFCNISFVGTRALVAALGDDADGIIISQVVPHPVGSQVPVVEAYRAALKKYSPDAEPDWISLEGYLAGRLFGAVADRAGADLTREAFLKALQGPDPFDLGGLSAQFGPNRNQGFDRVYLTQVKKGKIVSLE